eukprot:TRINITY_DN16682_c0_g1_i2.p1 TRINITY_DN16682_c0_g1~~TRINITY_DN16682_c0_g1_i2.p1  ORF type:complete len:272 (+),score=9.26 TRINITY_DN16682_c0_g1_i2:43-858(+)
MIRCGMWQVSLLMCFFFFSSRRRHTRSCLVSWARRCVQETGTWAGYRSERLCHECKIETRIQSRIYQQCGCCKRTHDRYLGRIFGLRFTDNSRFTLFSNLNNVNESRNPGNNGNWSPSNNAMGLTALKTIGADLLIDNRKGTFKDNMNGTISWKDAEDESREATENFLNKDNSYNCSTASSRNQSRAFSVSNKLNLHLPLDIEITNDLKQNHQSQTSLTRSATFTENPFFIGNVLTVHDSVFHHPPCTPVSYTHLTLPTICSVQISVVAGS